MAGGIRFHDSFSVVNEGNRMQIWNREIDQAFKISKCTIMDQIRLVSWFQRCFSDSSVLIILKHGKPFGA